MSAFDCIIVGAGASGATAAAVLCEAGKTVLLLERGAALLYPQVGQDHLRNHRLAVYGHNTGPELKGNPRVFVDQDGTAAIAAANESRYHNNAMTVGGGSRVYGAQAWRFHPKDFRMASVYGVPEGSSLADWPLGYEDLEPYYERAEWEMGVAGDSGENELLGPRKKGYPLPAVPSTLQREILARGGAKLGIKCAPVPLLINTQPYLGRGVCVQCGRCVGFACPSDAKSGSHNTMLPRALATGRCTLLTESIVERIHTDANGKASGISYFLNDKRCMATAKAIVLCGGAIESARLLLNSATSEHPRGLGNDSDQVGRHLQGHYYPGAVGLFSESTYDGIGPGVSISTCQWNHGNKGIIGGAMLANEFIKLPIIYHKWNMPPGMKKWGIGAKRWMRETYTRIIHVTGPVQEIPSPRGRVTIDPHVRDKWGIPVVRLSGTQHMQTIYTSEFIRERAEDWLKASGAKDVWSWKLTIGLSGGQHQSGTCRMGDDPRTSVTDRWGRVHGHENVYCADGSLHVTNGGFNPVLTILAMAFRTAEHVAGAL